LRLREIWKIPAIAQIRPLRYGGKNRGLRNPAQVRRAQSVAKRLGVPALLRRFPLGFCPSASAIRYPILAGPVSLAKE
jgi:hypothetical protein